MSSCLLPLRLKNCESVSLRGAQPMPFKQFQMEVLNDLAGGARVAAFFGVPDQGGLTLHAVLADGSAGDFRWWITRVGESYPALTPACVQFHWFEREIAEQWGIRPEGHPWLKPIRFHQPYRPADRERTPMACPDGSVLSGPCPEVQPLPGETNFFQVEGEEVHEVAVGPVHAGVIEPGHFRFQCHGEEVLHLEISLGYQHRGIERALACGPDRRTIHLIETLAGDTTVGHALAYCHAIESLSGEEPSEPATLIRGVALELERLANHTGDLGALANDVGYLPTASYCGRIRGDFLNQTALLCGNRFGRRLIRPGGLGVAIDATTLRELRRRVDEAFVDVTSAVALLWRTASVRARFENAGHVSAQTAIELGLVGVAARASGLERDARREFAVGAFRGVEVRVASDPGGNVQARAWVRWREIEESVSLIRRWLDGIGPDGSREVSRARDLRLRGAEGLISVVEGWRGELCHVALTDAGGRFLAYKVVDPSFHNWMGLAQALRNQQISDFPLCNKSFNLSYCGHDL
jgi:Ni,Fe-hydrogenase III large subunit